MSAKYTYSKTTDFPNQKINLGKLTTEIEESSITQVLDHINTEEDVCDIYFVEHLLSGEETILNNIVTNHDGAALDPEPLPVQINSAAAGVVLTSKSTGPFDRSGKLRMHQTSRKLGCVVCWTGVGDDSSDISKVGGGNPLTFNYEIGDEEPMTKYIDFNIAENETWLHEGYLTWKGGHLDKLSLQMVVRTVTVSGSPGSDKTLYGGYMVVPTAPGSGDVEIASDITEPHGGLVYMPNDDLDNPPVAYWDADYNTTTHKYENIRPNYTGTGRYNMFTYELVIAEFVREIPLLDSGFIALNSSDTDQLGQGMRLKMVADTNNNVDDHDWSVACILCMHRARTV